MTKNIGIIKLPINRLHMELTNICNFSCEFCPDSRMKRRRGMMNVDMAKAIVDEAGRTGIAKMVWFHVMGEPTLYPNLIDIVKYASDRNIETCLTTNGSRLDEKLLDELVTAGIGQIIISLQTPDEKTFAVRGARGITFSEYESKIVLTAKRFLSRTYNTKLIISFLSSPLRRLMTPIFPEVSIADTSRDLKEYLASWSEKIIKNSPVEGRYADISRQIRKTRSFKENSIKITDSLFFNSRILGDWSIHFDRKNKDAYFGYCHGIQENIGILFNGDYTFCCTDFDGRTSTDNFSSASIADYLESEVVQRVVRGFNRFRVVHPYCKQCIGDKSVLNTLAKQLGSIVYFKWMKKLK